MRALLVALALVLPACLELSPVGDGSKDSAAATGADAAAPGLTGIDCIVESTTGQTICSAVSACPSVYVNHDLFPTCGFRPASGVLDLECACTSSLCPIGVATTCEQAARLMNGQTQTLICQLEYEGRCAKSQGPGSTPTAKPCNDDCLIRCQVSDEGCPKRCGCAG